VISNGLGLLAVLIVPCCAAGDESPRLDLSLAAGERTWHAVGQGEVRWEGRDEAASIQLRPDSGYAGVAALLPDEAAGRLVDIEVTVSGNGKAELVASFSPEEGAVPDSPAWTADLSGGKRQRLAARLAPPAGTGAPLYLHLGARGSGEVTASDLVVVSEEVLAAVERPQDPALPADWEPSGNLDATPRRMGDATELLVEVAGVEFALVPQTACTVGTFAPLTALVTNRGDREKTLVVRAACPDGLAFDPREFPLTRAGTDRAVLRFQGLLPGAYAARMDVSCGEDAASVPVEATVARGYPAFGTTVSDGNQVTGRWQIREILVRASEQSTTQDLLAQVQPRLGDSPAIPVVHFDGLPAPEVLRAVVGELKGKVGLYGPAWRPDRPFAGGDPRPAAEALVAASREVFSTVRTSDLEAAVLSPVFDRSANEPGSPENRLLNACLDLGIAEYFVAVAVAGSSLPASGALGESVNGRNLRDASSFWTGLDKACYLSEVDMALESRDVYLPFLTSGIHGPASVDERLDALKAAHALACAAYVGCTGATFPGTALPGNIALTRPDGSLSAVGIAVKELGRELAGARAIARSWEAKDIPGRIGEGIVVLPFLRDSEAILVIWNNTSVAHPLTLVLRDVPYSEHRLAISHGDPFVARAYQDHFRFSDEAVKANAREVYIRLSPLQVMVVRYRFRVALPTWLASVEFTPKSKMKSGGPPEHDDRPWWKKLQDWADGKE